MEVIFPAGMVSRGINSTSTTTENVTVDGENVTVDSENVTVNVRSTTFIEDQIKFLTIVQRPDNAYEYTFCELNNSDFVDWATLSEGAGEDFDSYLETGTDILGDPTVDKYGNYMYTFLERTSPDSSCQFRIKWEWADDATSNKWTDLQEAYRLVNENPAGFEVVQTRNRIRGNGKAMRVRFQSSSGQDMRLLGWAVPFSGVPMS